jgi:hypothetical protein
MIKNSIEYIQDFGGRENYFPCKLKKDRIGDCVIRAIAIATQQDYMVALKELFAIGIELGNLPNSEAVYGAYLESKGFVKHKPFRNPKGKKYTVRELPIEDDGVYVIHTTSHVTTIMNRQIRDSWFCGDSSANSYYKK